MRFENKYVYLSLGTYFEKTLRPTATVALYVVSEVKDWLQVCNLEVNIMTVYSFSVCNWEVDIDTLRHDSW